MGELFDSNIENLEYFGLLNYYSDVINIPLPYNLTRKFTRKKEHDSPELITHLIQSKHSYHTKKYAECNNPLILSFYLLSNYRHLFLQEDFRKNKKCRLH
jgi:hypothetical protein